MGPIKSCEICKQGDLLVNKILILVLGMFLVGPCRATVPAVVDYVIDGDTFSAKVNLDVDVAITVRVRLINVDTPEIHGACQREINLAHRAKNYLKELLHKGTVVQLDSIKDDKYLGRINANVFMPDGRDVGLILIGADLGRPYAGGKRKSWCN